MKTEFKIDGNVYMFPYQLDNQFPIKFKPEGNASKHKLYNYDAYKVNELKNYILLIKDENLIWLLNYDLILKYLGCKELITPKTKIEKIVNLLRENISNRDLFYLINTREVN